MIRGRQIDWLRRNYSDAEVTHFRGEDLDRETALWLNQAVTLPDFSMGVVTKVAWVWSAKLPPVLGAIVKTQTGAVREFELDELELAIAPAPRADPDTFMRTHRFR